MERCNITLPRRPALQDGIRKHHIWRVNQLGHVRKLLHPNMNNQFVWKRSVAIGRPRQLQETASEQQIETLS